MPLKIRLLLPLLLGLALVMPAAVPASAATGDSPTQAESMMIRLLNAERTKRGLVPMRLDTRVARIARERSDYQAARDTGSHVHAGGLMFDDLLSAAGIKWYASGEIIAQNRYWPTLLDSAKVAVSGWLGSSTHRSILLSKGYNYVGIGFAVNPNSDRRYWTAIFMRGPDRTRPWAKTGTISKNVTSSTRVTVTLRWGGGDRRLQVLTSGLRYFQIQRRRAGGTWKSWNTTTSTYKRVSWVRNRTYEFRVRSRDRAGYWGAWQTVRIRT